MADDTAPDDAADRAPLRGPWVAFDAVAWLRLSEGLTLEEEGTLARMLAAMVTRDGPFPADHDIARHLLRTSPQAARRVLTRLEAAGILQRTNLGLSFGFAAKALADRAQMVERQRANAKKKRKNSDGNINDNSVAGEATAGIAQHTHTQDTHFRARRGRAPAAAPLGDGLKTALDNLGANLRGQR